ncbi:MAG: carboxymuconolactone decarboxylase family protein [Novosphingobium sp.]|nr:carboxymuconolactone decarboxylase family protein [Novosphingobium sp.]
MAAVGTINSGPIEFDVEERQKQVVGDGPRLAPLKMDEISEEGMEQVREIRNAFKIPEDGSIPDVSLITLRHPGMFRCQMAMGIELVARGTIPARERELAVLRLAWLARAPFEWSEHVVIGKKCGVTAEEIERVTQGSSAEGWSEHEAAVLRAVEELLGNQCISDETWETLARTYDEKQLLELPMLAGSYLMTAFQQNSIRTPLNKAYTGLNDR